MQQQSATARWASDIFITVGRAQNGSASTSASLHNTRFCLAHHTSLPTLSPKERPDTLMLVDILSSVGDTARQQIQRDKLAVSNAEWRVIASSYHEPAGSRLRALVVGAERIRTRFSRGKQRVRKLTMTT